MVLMTFEFGFRSGSVVLSFLVCGCCWMILYVVLD